MKQTILFSNVIGDITALDSDCSFNKHLTNVLLNADINNCNLVFINAPGFENDNLYFDKILDCFNKIGIKFNSAIEISDNSKINDLKDFPNNRVYFLMGGNPLTQYQLIKDYNLEKELKNYSGVVIGFCAGAINLSKYSIITSDDDFKNPQYYNGINRIDISIEPHFYLDNSAFTKNRVKEINYFCKQLNINIYALPDLSVINIIDNKMEVFGDVYKY